MSGFSCDNTSAAATVRLILRRILIWCQKTVLAITTTRYKSKITDKEFDHDLTSSMKIFPFFQGVHYKACSLSSCWGVI